jgi:rare lipoprotein A
MRVLMVLAALLIAGCAQRPHRAAAPPTASSPPRVHAAVPSPETERDGGPAIPPDVSRVPEPVPRAEPRAAYGNKSPYTVLGRTYQVLPSSRGYVERGIASWYGTKFHGRLTSSREPYDMYQMTAAHKALPLPTYVRVTNLENGRSVIVRVNDRGPFHGDRIIDLSYAAAVKLGVHAKGTAMVEVRALGPGATELAEGTPVTGSAVPLTKPGASTTKPVSNARNTPVFVQAGSFAERENAKRLAQRLRAADVDDVFVDRARAHGRRVHRVRVGPVDAARADALVARLARLGIRAVTVSE